MNIKIILIAIVGIGLISTLALIIYEGLYVYRQKKYFKGVESFLLLYLDYWKNLDIKKITKLQIKGDKQKIKVFYLDSKDVEHTITTNLNNVINSYENNIEAKHEQFSKIFEKKRKEWENTKSVYIVK